MGLIQRVIEASGIATISISVNRPYTEKIRPPRAMVLPWPFGHPLGAPDNLDQQTAVLHKAFETLYAIHSPGQIVDVNWPWQGEGYRHQACPHLPQRPLPTAIGKDLHHVKT